MLFRFLGSLRAHNLLDLLQLCTAGYETWIMHHTSFFSEATLIEAGVYDHDFFVLSSMLMRKNVNNDVSKDSPILKHNKG